MLDIGGDELLLTAVIAIMVIGPKDLPRAMRFVGRWVGKARRMNGAFRAGLENFVQEGEIRDLETEWATKREEILTQFASLEIDSASPIPLEPGSPPEKIAKSKKAPAKASAPKANVTAPPASVPNTLV